MANVIKLCKGLDINLKGKAAAEVIAAKPSKVYGLVPDAFYGVKPKIVVKEGETVKAGDALFVDKLHPASGGEVRIACQRKGNAGGTW